MLLSWPPAGDLTYNLGQGKKVFVWSFIGLMGPDKGRFVSVWYPVAI